MKRLFKIFLYTLVFVCCALFCVIETYTPVELNEEESFNSNVEAIRNFDFKEQTNNDEVSIGWARVNITPEKPRFVVGYGVKEFTELKDSVFVNCLFLTDNRREVALFSLDLLLVTPALKEAIEQAFVDSGVDLYISATHTHSSVGGFGKGAVSERFLGEYNEEFVVSVATKAKEVYQKAKENSSLLNSLTYGEKQVTTCLNRLIGGIISEPVRELTFHTADYTLDLSSFNAHPTMQKWRGGILSKDYPRIFSWDRDSSYGMFLSGTVGSIRGYAFQQNDTATITKYKTMIQKTPYEMKDSLPFKGLSFYNVPLETPPLTPVLREGLRLREWVGGFLFGDVQTDMQVLRIGEVLFVSLPCELSGEYYPELKELALKKGYRLMLTGFNGSYVGYATPSEHFHIFNMETRTMNWVGKYSGDYYNKLIEEIIDRLPTVQES